MADKRIEMGDRAKDRITGLSGIVVARTEWLYGCTRITIQPEEFKDGKVPDNYTVDEAQCEVLARGAISGWQRPSAPQPEPAHRGPAGGRQDVAVRHSEPPR